MIKKMAKVTTEKIGGIAVITVKLDKTDPRVCDYCNDLCAEPQERGLVVVQDCHVTQYGLMCRKCYEKCNGEASSLKTWKEGEIYRD